MDLESLSHPEVLEAASDGWMLYGIIPKYVLHLRIRNPAVVFKKGW
jgi:hypothetical protein